MLATLSKFSAPIAGAVLLVSAGLVSSANAAPLASGIKIHQPQSELIVKVDHRKHKKHRGQRGWDDRRGWGYHEMGPRQIRRSLRHRGFHKIRILDRRGPMYIVKARAWGGQKFRLVVDSRSAQIVRSRPVGGHRAHWGWQHRW
ncbi:hypothetical protein K1718_04895 [Roseibium porphyridii]|uniref:PepSY domain-containing protein n=1 Tax=Roseibium porphyridii TaxID=2866279 RepID=A0ABY8F5I6_9HYPH|nr:MULTISPECIES: hypothetical protein [Stappiaceae]QFT30014.1 hypothetical protein FIV00_05990 [Labrenzia sp. THAF82]WFE90689.1 hypothetical protein K1718_04895 [Roseibium sp. KMA01]